MARARPRRFGSGALLVDHPTMRPAALAERIRRLGLVDVVDVVVGASSVTVVIRSPTALPEVATAVEAVETDDATSDGPAGAADRRADHLEIPVLFDGPDLEEVAADIGLTAAGLVDIMTTTPLSAAFTGFTAGFAYLDGLPDLLHLPRRSTPRPNVAPGSVALAGGYAGVYTVESPGGWHIIGRTTLRLWDVDRRPPALIVPGMTVRMRAVSA